MPGQLRQGSSERDGAHAMHRLGFGRRARDDRESALRTDGVQHPRQDCLVTHVAIAVCAQDQDRLGQRLTDALAEGAASAPEAVAFSGVLDPGYRDPGDRVRGLIRDAIAEMAAAGEVVIVAHAASYTLGRDAGALRVLVTASPETRAGRMADGSAAPEKAVRDADRARAHYLKSFYDVSQEVPAHYDLVINTDSLTAAQAAGVISALARPA